MFFAYESLRKEWRMNVEEEMETLRLEILECTKCELAKNRKTPVPGEGSSKAEVVFVGEAPGVEEDKQGSPFVGAAGKFLDKLLGSIGVNRGEVFITNVVKCRPPKNRPPRIKEIATCSPYLNKQIELIDPKVICPMGNSAIKTLLSRDLSVGKAHGEAYRREDRIYMPLYHPAAALYNFDLRPLLFRDMKRLRSLMKGEIEVIKQVSSNSLKRQTKLDVISEKTH